MKLSDAVMQHKRAIGVTTAIVWLFGLYFVRDYLMLIGVSVILAFLFNPIYQRFLKKTKNDGRASMMTLLVALLMVVIPVSIIIILSVNQAKELIPNVGEYLGKFGTLDNFSDSLLKNINETIHSLGITVDISRESFQNFIKNTTHTAASTLVRGTGSLISSFFNFFTVAIIFIMTFTSILKYQKSILSGLKTLSPLGPEITTEYLNRIGLMTNAYIGSPAPGLLFFASDGVSNMPYDAPGVLPIIHQKNVVIIRYDATSRQLETTLNGQSNGTVNVPAGMNITNSDSLKFGGSKVMYDFYASAIWNQALSETQVQQVNDALAQ